MVQWRRGNALICKINTRGFDSRLHLKKNKVFSKNAAVAKLVYAHDLRSCSARNVGSSPTRGTVMKRVRKYINQDFFKTWSPNMAYVLGYVSADGCIHSSKDRKDSYILNITSKDKSHLVKIKNVLESEYKISTKFNGTKTGGVAYHIQVRNNTICNDLINLGIHQRKTHTLQPITVPDEYFPDFVRGFFDGDGTVYLYKVNGTWQIKTGFVCVSLPFIDDLNTKLCKALDIPVKKLHEDKPKNGVIKYSIDFYIDDSKKFFDFMYKDASLLFLTRKKKVFEKWKTLKRRRYIKNNDVYPSKIGWHLNSR